MPVQPLLPPGQRISPQPPAVSENLPAHTLRHGQPWYNSGKSSVWHISSSTPPALSASNLMEPRNEPSEIIIEHSPGVALSLNREPISSPKPMYIIAEGSNASSPNASPPAERLFPAISETSHEASSSIDSRINVLANRFNAVSSLSKSQCPRPPVQQELRQS